MKRMLPLNLNLNGMALQKQAELNRTRLNSLGIQQGVPDQVAPGTLYIADHFLPDLQQPVSEVHGAQVEAAARSTGFAGQIVLRDFPSTHAIVYDPSLPPEPGQTPRAAEFLQHLSWKTQERYQQVLLPATQQLQELTEGGARNSVLNLSMGTDRSRVVEEAFLAFPRGQGDLQGAAEAFGLQVDHLLSPDPKVAGPEIARLQQGLIDRVDHTVRTSGSIAEAKDRYDRAVEQFEAGYNSVVVSGGNQGLMMQGMRMTNHGALLMTGPDFYDSPLVNAHTTVVGSTQGDGSTVAADFSAVHRLNQILASGDGGSSFASPRVAASMAHLHGLHRDHTSTQIESMLSQQFCTHEGDLPVLKPSI